MTERGEYTPSLEEVCEDFAHVSGWIIDPKARAIHDARVAAFWRMIEAVRQEERKKAARWKATAESADALLRAVMAELDIRPDEDPVLAVRGIVAGIRNDEREKAAQIADRMHGVGNDIVARRIREQGKEQYRG